jgi:hypothetical protein
MKWIHQNSISLERVTLKFLLLFFFSRNSFPPFFLSFRATPLLLLTSKNQVIMKTLIFTRKVLAIFIMAICCQFSSKMIAQTIEIDSLFTADGEIFPFGPNDTIYGLSISGHVTLSSDTSLVRVILTDNSGQEWMVYEAYPMIVENTSFNIEQKCDETCFLNTFVPYSLNIQIINANLDVSSLDAETESKPNIDDLQYQVKRENDVEKVQMINYNIHQRDWNWTAGDNELISKYYFEKSIVFTNNKYNLQGFDYYSGGVFKYVSFHENTPDRNSTLNRSFDWRKKHDATTPGSNYYFGENGWITPF